MATYLSSSKARRHQAKSSRTLHLKYAIRLAAAAFDVVGISLLIVAIPSWNANFRHNSGPSPSDWTDAFLIVPVCTV